MIIVIVKKVTMMIDVDIMRFVSGTEIMTFSFSRNIH